MLPRLLRHDASKLRLAYLLTGGFLVFLRLIMMPLDGIEHAYAKDEKLERQEHYRKPIDPTRIHRLNTFKLLRDMICRMQNLHQSCCFNNLSY